MEHKHSDAMSVSDRTREPPTGSVEARFIAPGSGSSPLLVIPACFWRDCEGMDAEANGEAGPKGARQSLSST
jgi:hypothetical protein